ncbi:MAG: response regulator transcription factor, partial [Desulfobacterales bacterium]|nr:response regulator transcription factor [Desulfobacterales bacterium]
LRRVKGDKLSDDKFKIAVIRRGSLLIDIESHIVTIDDKVIDLTPTEFKILEMLSKNAGRVFSRSKIVEQIQGYEFEGYERTIDVHVKNLRRKLSEYSQDKNLIVTVHGLGYKFMES